MLGRSLQKQKMFGSMIQCSQRAFAGGGPSKAPIDKDETEFDLVLVGGANSAALLKHLQANDDAQNLKMAVISPSTAFIQPQVYFGVIQGHISDL
jgi:peptidase E